MQIDTVRIAAVVRRLLEVSNAHLRTRNDLDLFVSLNLMHDAVEAFLLAVAIDRNVKPPKNPSFENILDAINNTLQSPLPYQTRLQQLNKQRVSSKHYLNQPSREDCERFLIVVGEFLDSVSIEAFGTSFWRIGLTMMLDEGPERSAIESADAAYETGNFEECLVCCRKALFLAVEKIYDVRPFHEKDATLVWEHVCRAPRYACNKGYVESEVLEPTGYIVIDYFRLNQTLLEIGVSPAEFWNVRKLTPDVFRVRDDPEHWIVKKEFAKLCPEGIEERAGYVLATTTRIILASQNAARSVRHSEDSQHFIELARKTVPVYAKASRNSTVIKNASKRRLLAEYSIEGLDGETYYYVCDISHNPILGFIHASDVL